MPRGPELPLDEKVRDTQRSSTSFVLPLAVSVHLDRLVDAAIDAGEDRRLSRTDLVCALIVMAERDGDRLRSGLETFRTASVRDLFDDHDVDVDNVIALKPNRPGPRRRA